MIKFRKSLKVWIPLGLAAVAGHEVFRGFVYQMKRVILSWKRNEYDNSVTIVMGSSTSSNRTFPEFRTLTRRRPNIEACRKVVSNYCILRQILSHLHLDDLKRCMDVCKIWRSAAISAIRQGQWIQCHSNGLSNACHDQKRQSLHGGGFSYASLLHDQPSDIQDLDSEILYCPAQLTLLFHPVDLPRKERCGSRLTESIFHFVHNDRPEIDTDSCPCSYIRFPQWEGAKISTISIAAKLIYTVDENTMEEIVLGMLNLPEGIEIKAVIVFNLAGGEKTVHWVLNLLKRKFSPSFAFGGSTLIIGESVQFFVFTGENVYATSGIFSSAKCCNTDKLCNYCVANNRSGQKLDLLKKNIPDNVQCGALIHFRKGYSAEAISQIEWNGELLTIYGDDLHSICVYGANYFPLKNNPKCSVNMLMENPQCACITASMYIGYL